MYVCMHANRHCGTWIELIQCEVGTAQLDFLGCLQTYSCSVCEYVRSITFVKA